jgi:hypothetical protein
MSVLRTLCPCGGVDQGCELRQARSPNSSGGVLHHRSDWSLKVASGRDVEIIEVSAPVASLDVVARRLDASRMANSGLLCSSAKRHRKR